MRRRLYRSWGFAAVLVVVLAAAPVTSGPKRPEPRGPPGGPGRDVVPDGRARLLSAAHYPHAHRRRCADARPPGRWPSSCPTPAGTTPASPPPPPTACSAPATSTAWWWWRPSHHGAFRGYALDDATAYRTPLGEIPLCGGVTEALASDIAPGWSPGVTEPEHAVEIELPFLQAALGALLPGPGPGRGHRRHEPGGLRRAAGPASTTGGRSSSSRPTSPTTARASTSSPSAPCLRDAREDPGDGRPGGRAPRAEGRREGLPRLPRETGNTICGRHGLATMLELLPRIAPGAEATLLAHYASADLPGLDDSSSVTYVALGYAPAAEPGDENGLAPGAGSAAGRAAPAERRSPPTPLR